MQFEGFLFSTLSFYCINQYSSLVSSTVVLLLANWIALAFGELTMTENKKSGVNSFHPWVAGFTEKSLSCSVQSVWYCLAQTVFSLPPSGGGLRSL